MMQKYISSQVYQHCRVATPSSKKTQSLPWRKAFSCTLEGLSEVSMRTCSVSFSFSSGLCFLPELVVLVVCLFGLGPLNVILIILQHYQQQMTSGEKAKKQYVVNMTSDPECAILLKLKQRRTGRFQPSSLVEKRAVWYAINLHVHMIIRHLLLNNFCQVIVLLHLCRSTKTLCKISSTNRDHLCQETVYWIRSISADYFKKLSYTTLLSTSQIQLSVCKCGLACR